MTSELLGKRNVQAGRPHHNARRLAPARLQNLRFCAGGMD